MMTVNQKRNGFNAVLKIRQGRSGLVLSGLHVTKGILFKSDNLFAYCADPGENIPFWWEARAFWPDGSVRWIFFHALTSPGAEKLFISCCDDPVNCGSYPKCEIRQGNGETDKSLDFDVIVDGSPVISISSLLSESSDKLSDATLEISLPEASPFAPLFRISSKRDGNISTEFLVRADLASKIFILTCRHSLRFREITELGEIITKAVYDEKYFGDASAVITDEVKRGPAIIRDFPDEPCRFDFVLFPDHSGKIKVKGGISLRQEYRIGPKGELSLSEVIIDGTIPPSLVAPGVAKGIERSFARAAERYDEPKRQNFNILDDGDWPLSPGQYGAKEYTAYADNEYDAPYAFFLAHEFTGIDKYLDIALRGSIHMADIDCMCDTGDMLYHGYNEQAQDHRLHRVGSGDLGHYWTDGLWKAYFLTGDVFAKEAALALMRYIIRRFDDLSLEEAFAVCERNIGWPLMVAVSELETGLADDNVKGFIERIIRFVDKYTADPDSFYLDPDGPLWWRCAFRDGSKPFMLGVLGEALVRYHELTGDERVADILVRISDFILEQFDPVRVDFSYEFNAYGPNVREINAQQLIPLFIRTILAGAVITNDEGKIAKAAAAFHAAAWCLFDFETGKDIAIMARGFIPSIEKMMDIYHLHKEKITAGAIPSDGISPFEWADDKGFVQADFDEGVYSDCGSIQIRYKSDKKPENTLNTQALVHFCDRLPYHSCVSVIFFYNRLQARFYDERGRLITSLDHITDDSFFEPGKTHIIEINYSAPGKAFMRVDDEQSDIAVINRYISGAFRSVMTGSKPGNWSADGSIAVRAHFERGRK